LASDRLRWGMGVSPWEGLILQFPIKEVVIVWLAQRMSCPTMLLAQRWVPLLLGFDLCLFPILNRWHLSKIGVFLARDCSCLSMSSSMVMRRNDAVDGYDGPCTSMLSLMVLVCQFRSLMSLMATMVLVRRCHRRWSLSVDVVWCLRSWWFVQLMKTGRIGDSRQWRSFEDLY